MKRVYVIGLLTLIGSLQMFSMGPTNVVNKGYMNLGGMDMFGKERVIYNSGTLVNPGPNTYVVNSGEGKVESSNYPDNISQEPIQETMVPQSVETYSSNNN